MMMILNDFYIVFSSIEMSLRIVIKIKLYIKKGVEKELCYILW